MADKKNSLIGWIGLGNMGYPMAKNLEKAGFPLSVYNRNPERSEDFKAESGVAGSIAELIGNCDIIFTMLTNDQAVQAVYDQILSVGDLEGKLFIDMSTISQQLSIATAENIRSREASFIDAPVAGSTKPATEGTLIIMAGGATEDLDRAQPYFEKLGKTVKHLGKNGNGIAAKLCVNYFVSILYQGLAETVLFAEHQGIERADILDIINESATGSGATKVKTPSLLANDYPAAFALDLMLKDILLAKDNGANFPLTESLVQVYQSAHDNGLGEQDVMAIIKNISKQ